MFPKTGNCGRPAVERRGRVSDRISICKFFHDNSTLPPYAPKSQNRPAPAHMHRRAETKVPLELFRADRTKPAGRIICPKFLDNGVEIIKKIFYNIKKTVKMPTGSKHMLHILTKILKYIIIIMGENNNSRSAVLWCTRSGRKLTFIKLYYII